MDNIISIEKAERLAKTKGLKGWIAMFILLGTMCFDQFILDIPFANVVFPILVVTAASMSTLKNILLVVIYSVIFELSCIAWFPADLLRVQWWLLEVTIGYMMPFVVYKLFNRKHKNMSVFKYAAIASLAELMYFWVSVAATIILWGVNPIVYILSDIPYEILGCAATFVCAVPIAFIYKLVTKEIDVRKYFEKTSKPALTNCKDA